MAENENDCYEVILSREEYQKLLAHKDTFSDSVYFALQVCSAGDHDTERLWPNGDGVVAIASVLGYIPRQCHYPLIKKLRRATRENNDTERTH